MRRSSNGYGVMMMLLAVSSFSLMDAGIKGLSTHYPALQVAALRGLASWPLVALWVWHGGGLRRVMPVRWSLHLLRGGLAVLMMVAFTFGVRNLPMASAYTLFFVAPLLITALSGPILGEHVGLRRWLAIAIGFVGVVVALRPSPSGLVSWGALAVLVAAAAYAVSAITVRVLSRTDSTQSMVFWLITALAFGSTALAWPDWQNLQPQHYLLVAFIGVTGVVGQYAITEAFSHGQASVIAPLEYTALAWGLAFDALIWAVLPDGYTAAGAVLIVGSGIYLLLHARSARAVLHNS